MKCVIFALWGPFGVIFSRHCQCVFVLSTRVTVQITMAYFGVKKFRPHRNRAPFLAIFGSLIRPFFCLDVTTFPIWHTLCISLWSVSQTWVYVTCTTLSTWRGKFGFTYKNVWGFFSSNVSHIGARECWLGVMALQKWRGSKFPIEQGQTIPPIVWVRAYF